LPLAAAAPAAGLTLFSVVPTTLGVGVALVRSCKGNEAIALLLTVASNMLGIVTMPLMLKMLLDNRSDVSVSYAGCPGGLGGQVGLGGRPAAAAAPLP
jgi:sodium/bile acid cotransporter 7